MLSVTKNRSSLLRQVTVMAVALSVLCLVLTALSVQDRTDGVSTLSNQDMENIVGGFTCCDNCDMGFEGFEECWHFPAELLDGVYYAQCGENPTCCSWIWSSASCQPNQTSLDFGCDTIALDPPVSGAIGRIYLNGNMCPHHSWTAEEFWAKGYFGCDSNNFTCSGHWYRGYCEAPWACAGDFDDMAYKGVQYTCGCS